MQQPFMPMGTQASTAPSTSTYIQQPRKWFSTKSYGVLWWWTFTASYALEMLFASEYHYSSLPHGSFPFPVYTSTSQPMLSPIDMKPCLSLMPAASPDIIDITPPELTSQKQKPVGRTPPRQYSEDEATSSTGASERYLPSGYMTVSSPNVQNWSYFYQERGLSKPDCRDSAASHRRHSTQETEERHNPIRWHRSTLPVSPVSEEISQKRSSVSLQQTDETKDLMFQQ